jgi:methylated-DNA-[protein]-cysteine S-methyltransferase
MSANFFSGGFNMSYVSIYESPIGKILVSASDRGVIEVSFAKNGESCLAMGETNDASGAILKECSKQLEEYFTGCRRSFDVPLDLNGTPFQLSVWRTLLLIPFGATWSYGKVASQIGRPKSSRAVGGANHRNPVSIIVPCHRVIGSDGKLTGYGGGLWRKEWLIAHESK